MTKDGKRIVYRAFSPSRNPDIGKVYYDRIDAEIEVRRQNANARILSPKNGRLRPPGNRGRLDG